jgi:hypothetical protein
MVTFGVEPKPPVTVTPVGELAVDVLCEAFWEVEDVLDPHAETAMPRAATTTRSAEPRREG